jgi:hypothetical protein
MLTAQSQHQQARTNDKTNLLSSLSLKDVYFHSVDSGEIEQSLVHYQYDGTDLPIPSS